MYKWLGTINNSLRSYKIIKMEKYFEIIVLKIHIEFSF